MVASIIALVGLITLSAYFSASETAFSSLNRLRMKNLSESGNKRAALVLSLSEDYNTLLSTILVGNNIVNITAASVATVLFVRLMGNTGATVSTVVMTVAVLIFGEVSPKTLAKENPERFALFSAPFLYWLKKLLTPVNWFFSAWKRLLTRVFKTGSSSSITEEELLTMVDEAAQEGAINAEDKTLIRSAIDFNDSEAADILTPRIDVEAIPIDATRQEITDVFLDTGYTRLPVYEGTINKIIGSLHLRDFFETFLKNPNVPLVDMLSPMVFVTPHAKINEIMHMMQQKKAHIAVVTDEYGGTMGIVTMEDIIEELVGEIWDEHDEVEMEIRPLADGSFIAAGSANVEDLFQTCGLAGESEAKTVNGWIMERLERVPEAGDAFSFQGMAVTVSQVKSNRVTECRLTPETATDPDAPAPAEG